MEPTVALKPRQYKGRWMVAVWKPMTTTFESRRRQVKLYVDWMEEQWKRDFQEAQACLDFERALAFGILLYEQFTALIDEWRELAVEAVLDGRENRYNPNAHKASEELMRWWLRPCDNVKQRIQQFQKKGYSIPDAEKFHRYCAEARWFLATDDQLAATPALRDLREAAEEEHRRGDTVELEF